jgi:hypothetical protein
VNDLSKWAIMQMNNGKYGTENKQLFSQKSMMKCGKLLFQLKRQSIIPISMDMLVLSDVKDTNKLHILVA